MVSDGRALAVERVRGFLLDKGVDPADIDRAAAEDRLDLLVVDALLIPPSRRYTLEEAAAAAGVALGQVRRLWMALGLPEVGEGQPGLTDLDVDALRTVSELLRLGVTDTDSTVALARVIGQSMARIAEAAVTVSPVVLGRTDSAELAELFAFSAEASIPAIVTLIEYAWRRHLQAAGRQAMLVRAGPGGAFPSVEMAVGFADLVGYTVLSQQASDEELAEVVGRFEAVAHEVITSMGGRLVKMIGDEAMFVVADASQGVRIGVELADAYAGDELLTDVRVGLATGPLLAREGDYYGPVVNLASRVVNIARPGTVLVSEPVHDALADEGGLVWKPLRPRSLKDIGRVRLWAVTRPGGDRPPRFWTTRAAPS